MSKISSLFRVPKLSYRVWKVWSRNKDVFMKTYKTNFLPSLLEPILYLLALGLGLGGFVQPINGESYIQFIAPALVAVSMMYSSFYECTYASYVRMYFQKTFDAIIATPITIEEVITGEILWGATKSLINSSIVLVVILVFGLIPSPLFLLIPPVSFLVGLLFSAIAMCFTAITPNIDAFNYPSFLFITPMFLLSGTFFPLTTLPEILQIIAQIFLPLTNAVNVTRSLALGNIQFSMITNLAWMLIVTPIFFVLAINLMKKRLIK
ncbi:ABC transporter permease [miscellaneous Crenarchaeota group-1 archaeon SG8-32-1]|jgi:lipooligosaccharide transport system permease protein|uniref:ABC transporter permease n=1 Tax=miscellaneous Crenarchaeota group-1 archaeon SG8-32-1 TaxID=1685124 RepID=A0A0M0BXW4_9ARCH|nr:MAG: ABC transporter permease [miscellaneous Crenarchaeota group-1 archaeon SG8-32-1]